MICPRMIAAAVILVACAPKHSQAQTVDKGTTNQSMLAYDMGPGALFFVDGKRLLGSPPNHDDIGDIEIMAGPQAEKIFGPGAHGGIVRMTTKSHLPPPSKSGCQTPEHPYFEFQVSEPATYTDLEWNYPHPSRRKTGTAVQFVVDTAGRPDVRTFHVLLLADTALAVAAKNAVSGWRFTPAMFDGCRVPQLVQTDVTR